MLDSAIHLIKAGIVRMFARKQQVAFLHIPKCGGQSVEHALRRYYPLSSLRIHEIASVQVAQIVSGSDPFTKGYRDVFALRTELLCYFLYQNIPCISGHFCFHESLYHEFHATYRFVTLVRHPVRRWISHYFYNTYKTHSTFGKIQEELIEFLQSARAKSWGGLYVQMLGGVDQNGDYASPQAIQRAVQNIDKFAVIGYLEDLEGFCGRFERGLGMRLRLPRKNRNPKAEAFIQAAITLDIEQQITQICQPDIAVYNMIVTHISTHSKD